MEEKGKGIVRQQVETYLNQIATAIGAATAALRQNNITAAQGELGAAEAILPKAKQEAAKISN